MRMGSNQYNLFPWHQQQCLSLVFANRMDPKMGGFLTKIESLNFDFKDEIKYGDLIIDIISQARGEKSINNLSLKTPITNLELELSSELKSAIQSSIKDFKATLFIEELTLTETNGDYKIIKIQLKKENEE